MSGVAKFPAPLQQDELLDSELRREASNERRRPQGVLRAAALLAPVARRLGRFFADDPRSLEAAVRAKDQQCRVLAGRQDRLQTDLKSLRQTRAMLESLAKEIKQQLASLRSDRRSLGRDLEAAAGLTRRCKQQQEEILKHFASHEGRKLRQRAKAAVLREGNVQAV